MALDVFETLISLGSGFASGAATRKRENELLELDNKKQEQTIRVNRINSIERSLIALFNSEMFSAESMMSALNSVTQLVDDERGAEAFGQLERKPGDQRPLTPRERFETQEKRLGNQFQSQQNRLIANEDFDRAEAKRKAEETRRKAEVDAAKTVKAQELSRQKEVSDILKEEVDDIQSRITQNNLLLKDKDTPVVDRATARRENIDFKRVLSAKNRDRKKIKDALRPPITKSNIKSKAGVLRKILNTGAISKRVSGALSKSLSAKETKSLLVKEAIDEVKKSLVQQINSGDLSKEDALEIITTFRRTVGGS